MSLQSLVSRVCFCHVFTCLLARNIADACLILLQVQFFHHPHFKQGCPQLLRHILRRVGIKKKYQALESLLQKPPKESCRAGEVLAKSNGNASVVPRDNINPQNYACFGASPRRCSPSVADTLAPRTDAIRGASSAPSSSSAIPSAIKDTLTLETPLQLTSSQLVSSGQHPHSRASVMNVVSTTHSSLQNYTRMPPCTHSYPIMPQPSGFPLTYVEFWSHQQSSHPSFLVGNPHIPRRMMAQPSFAYSLTHFQNDPTHTTKWPWKLLLHLCISSVEAFHKM